MEQLILTPKLLDDSLEEAKTWSKKNLKSYLKGFDGIYDYDKFQYIVDNAQLGHDMFFDIEEKGLIRVSTNQLLWYQDREREFEGRGYKRKARIFDEYFDIIGGVEVDPQSMFVHEIAEFIFDTNPRVYLNYFSPVVFSHDIAYHLENINRKERNLKLWPQF